MEPRSLFGTSHDGAAGFANVGSTSVVCAAPVKSTSPLGGYVDGYARSFDN